MTKEEKKIREELASLQDEMSSITRNAKAENRDLTKQEGIKHDSRYNQVKVKKKELDAVMALEGNKDFSNARNVNDLTDGKYTAPKGGRTLDTDGKVKAYAANQSIAADADDDVDISLGEYLRAVVDKPRSEKERQAIHNSITSGDYELPTRVAGELIDKLRAVNPLLMEGGAGARTISIEGGDTKFVKITGDATAVWHAEMTEETPSDPSFDNATFSPKTVLALTEVGRETLQDAANIEEALTTQFVGALNNAILSATFTGSGANTPSGLATTVTQTEEFTFNGDPDWGTFVKASKQLYDANVPEGNRSFVIAPDVWQTLAMEVDSQNRFQDAPSFIRNIPHFTSTGVTTGEGYVADFSNLVYGFRLGITLNQFPAEAAKKYGSLWVAAARLDIQTFRPSAFVRIEEAAS